MKSVLDFQSMKQNKQKISMVTCYDAWSAKILNATTIDCILVGDSAAMVMHGFSNTLAADTQLMAAHVAAVSRGAPDKFIVADIPFLEHRKGLAPLMDTVQTLMRSGAHAVKLERAQGHLAEVAHVVESGVPVMGHLGLTPQSVNEFGGFKVQGKNSAAAEEIVTDAVALEAAGCFAVVLECIPELVARRVTHQLSIPTIGIGAGAATSGQVLVLQDILGVDPDFQPGFVRQYLNGYELIKGALDEFDADIKCGRFPQQQSNTPSRLY